MALGRLRTYANFVKLEHSVFSLPLILVGVLAGAGRWPSAGLLGLVLIAAVAGRVTAMGLNRLIDAEIDRRNPRTRQRELPAAVMTPREGWAVVGATAAVYLLSAAAISRLCLLLAPTPLILFVIYPYLKRTTPLCHLGLGLAWSMGPLGGWIAGAQTLDGLGRVAGLWLFAVLWVTGFDIIYATMDEAFDRAEGLHSLPADIGRTPALAVSAVLHAAAVAALAWWAWDTGRLQPGLPWLTAIIAVLIWQQWLAPRRPDIAFFQANAPVGFLVLGLALAR